MAIHRTKRTGRKALRTLKDEPPRAIVVQEHNRPYTQAQLAEIGRRYLNAMQEADTAAAEAQRQRAEQQAELEAWDREGVTLQGRRLEHARSLLNALNMTAASVHGLAQSACATSDPQEAGAYLSAIEDCMVLTCRRADALAEYLGESPAFGNFLTEVQALSLERAAQLDREDAEREAAE